MNEQELIAEARRVGDELRRRPGDLDRLAGALLRELAARLEWHAVTSAEDLGKE